MTGDVQVPDGDRDVETVEDAQVIAIAAVLAAHGYWWGDGLNMLFCDCGWAMDDEIGYEDGLPERTRSRIGQDGREIAAVIRHRAHVADMVRAAFASQPAQSVTDEAVEAGWKVAPVGYSRWAVRNILTTALPHLTPAQSGDGVDEAVEKAWDEGHRRGYSDGYDDNGNGYEHDPDVEYTPQGNPYRIARTTTEEADHD